MVASSDLVIDALFGIGVRLPIKEEAQKMIAAVKAAGGNPRYSELADGDHSVWKQAYDDEAALIQHCKSRMASFKVPKRVVFVESLPKNPSGKLLKRELRDRLGRT